MPKQLVTAADREQRRTVVHRRLDRLALGAGKIAGDRDLFLILPTTEEEDVGLLGDCLTDSDLDHARRNAAPPGPLGERQDVAAITVNVHPRPIEPGDGQSAIRGHLDMRPTVSKTFRRRRGQPGFCGFQASPCTSAGYTPVPPRESVRQSDRGPLPGQPATLESWPLIHRHT